MAGIAIVLDLLRKSQSFNSKQSLHSSTLSSASVVASAAAISAAAGAPFASSFLFSPSKTRFAHCDTAAAIDDDYIASIKRISAGVLHNDSINYTAKEYKIEPKPLFSAFEFRALAMTTLRSFLMYYLPLLEPKMESEEDDDFLQDASEEHRVDLVVPFKKSVKQIGRETTVVTTRRILERLAVHYVSQRMAWKLLKDVPQSALRKAQRGLPAHVYIFRVSRTTLRGHFLGVAASWIVQVGIESYRCISRLRNKPEEEDDQVEISEQAKLFGKKVTGITIRCGASLIFAAIGAGLCAYVIRPSSGQWIGCALGDLAGPVVVSVCLGKALKSDL